MRKPPSLSPQRKAAADAFLDGRAKNRMRACEIAGIPIGKAWKTRANRASLVFKEPAVVEYMAKVQAAATERTVRGAQHVLEELWHDADALKPLVLNGSNRAAAANARKGILELLGRHYRNWSPDDAADATADHIPLAERLKHYQREQAIDEAPNVERLRKSDVRSA